MRARPAERGYSEACAAAAVSGVLRLDRASGGPAFRRTAATQGAESPPDANKSRLSADFRTGVQCCPIDFRDKFPEFLEREYSSVWRAACFRRSLRQATGIINTCLRSARRPDPEEESLDDRSDDFGTNSRLNGHAKCFRRPPWPRCWCHWRNQGGSVESAVTSTVRGSRHSADRTGRRHAVPVRRRTLWIILYRRNCDSTRPWRLRVTIRCRDHRHYRESQADLAPAVCHVSRGRASQSTLANTAQPVRRVPDRRAGVQSSRRTWDEFGPREAPTLTAAATSYGSIGLRTRTPVSGSAHRFTTRRTASTRPDVRHQYHDPRQLHDGSGQLCVFDPDGVGPARFRPRSDDDPARREGQRLSPTGGFPGARSPSRPACCSSGTESAACSTGGGCVTPEGCALTPEGIYSNAGSK